MPRYRLRYLSSDLEMPVGEFVIGRSSSCSLALDDALVSRRHAIIHVGDGEIRVEDLGSRNGISVNGERVEGTRTLTHMDRLQIGSQEMLVVEQGRKQPERPTSELLLCSNCKAPSDASARTCGECGAPLVPAHTLGKTLEFRRPPNMPSFEGEGPDTQPEAEPAEHPPKGLLMLAGIVEKALGMGRYEEAERILSQQLDALLEKAKTDGEVPQDQLEKGTTFALRLASGLKRARWVNWAFEVHQATGELMATETIEALHNVVRTVHYEDPRPLRAYLEVLRKRNQELSAAQRFLIRRLEGLERVISA